jgi:hypothetical protein
MTMKRTGVLRRHKPIVAALVSVVALSGVAAATLGGFSATIVNPTNTFASGTLQLEESSGATNCFSTGTGSGGTVDASNSATCSTINKLGNALHQVPAGTPVSTTVTMTNVGNLAADTAALQADACTASASSDNGGYTGTDLSGFCGKVDVTIDNTTTGAADKCLFPTLSSTDACDITTSGSAGTLASLASTSVPGITALAAGQSNTYKFTVMLDPSADNADQGLSASLPLTWTLNAGSGIPGGGSGGGSPPPALLSALNLNTTDNNFGAASSISCPSDGNCTAVGYYTDSSGEVFAFAQSETTGVWGDATQIGPSFINTGSYASLGSVSCVSPGNCTAVGTYDDASSQQQAMAVTETAGTWGDAVELAGDLNLGSNAGTSAVVCTSTGNCTADGYYTDASAVEQSFVVTQSAGTWGTPAAMASGLNVNGSQPTSLSCPTAGNCTASGYYTDSSYNEQAYVVDEVSGTWSSPTELAGSLNYGTAQASIVSCSSPGNCTTAGSYTDASNQVQAWVAIETGGTWAPATEVAASLNTGGYASLDSVSCPSDGNCTIVGVYSDSSDVPHSMAVTETAGTLGTPTPIITNLSTTYGSASIAISCATADNCTLIGVWYDATSGTHTVVQTETAGVWGNAQLIGSSLNPANFSQGNSVSCSSPGNCGVAGFTGLHPSESVSGFLDVQANGAWG